MCIFMSVWLHNRKIPKHTVIKLSFSSVTATIRLRRKCLIVIGWRVSDSSGVADHLLVSNIAAFVQ